MQQSGWENESCPTRSVGRLVAVGSGLARGGVVVERGLDLSVGARWCERGRGVVDLAEGGHCQLFLVCVRIRLLLSRRVYLYRRQAAFTAPCCSARCARMTHRPSRRLD